MGGPRNKLPTGSCSIIRPEGRCQRSEVSGDRITSSHMIEYQSDRERREHEERMIRFARAKRYAEKHPEIGDQKSEASSVTPTESRPSNVTWKHRIVTDDGI